jgi:hypothetical protein
MSAAETQEKAMRNVVVEVKVLGSTFFWEGGDKMEKKL